MEQQLTSRDQERGQESEPGLSCTCQLLASNNILQANKEAILAKIVLGNSGQE